MAPGRAQETAGTGLSNALANPLSKRKEPCMSGVLEAADLSQTQISGRRRLTTPAKATQSSPNSTRIDGPGATQETVLQLPFGIQYWTHT